MGEDNVVSSEDLQKVLKALEEASPVEGDVSDAMAGEDSVVPIPTGAFRNGRPVVVSVTLRDPRTNVEAIALELGQDASRGMRRLWSLGVVKPREILRSREDNLKPEDRSADSKAYHDELAVWMRGGQQGSKPVCFEDLSAAFKTNLTQVLALKFGMTGDFSARFLARFTSQEEIQEALRAAKKSSTTSPAPTASTPTPPAPGPVATPAASPPPTSGSGSPTPTSAASASPISTSASPAVSSPASTSPSAKASSSTPSSARPAPLLRK